MGGCLNHQTGDVIENQDFKEIFNFIENLFKVIFFFREKKIKDGQIKSQIFYEHEIIFNSKQFFSHQKYFMNLKHLWP